MALVTPNWSDNQTIISDQVVTRGTTVRGTLDLRAKIGAVIFAAVGRGGTAAITTAPSLQVRRTLANNTIEHPANGASRALGTVAATAVTTVNADSTAGQAVLNVATSTAFAAGDLISIQDGTAVTRLEFKRVSKVGGAGTAQTMTLDSTLEYTHTAVQADNVRHLADVFADFWLAGGATYAFVYDYGAATAGDNLTVRLRAQTYDSDTIV